MISFSLSEDDIKLLILALQYTATGLNVKMMKLDRDLSFSTNPEDIADGVNARQTLWHSHNAVNDLKNIIMKQAGWGQ